MHNVVVLLYTEQQREALRLYVNDEENNCDLGRRYSRADWGTVEIPMVAYVVGCNTSKSAFQLRLKFNTYPTKGVEFL